MMSGTKKLIRWQRITILLLIASCIAIAIHARDRERRIRTIAAINLRNVRHEIVAEKIAREEGRQEHENDQQIIEALKKALGSRNALLKDYIEQQNNIEQRYSGVEVGQRRETETDREWPWANIGSHEVGYSKTLEDALRRL
ncbi:MAG: hypothetical protein V4671_16835 [Armatimonadota bacterium]